MVLYALPEVALREVVAREPKVRLTSEGVPRGAGPQSAGDQCARNAGHSRLDRGNQIVQGGGLDYAHLSRLVAPQRKAQAHWEPLGRASYLTL
jgi:hypothetical protein